MPMYEVGTHYSCGCWRGGDPSNHPHDCPTHGKKWQYRYVPKKKLDLHPIKKDWDVTKQGEKK